MNHGGGRLFQRLKRADDGRQFHAVVGGCRIAARQFLFVLARAQDGRPAARPGISRTGAVVKISTRGGSQAVLRGALHLPMKRRRLAKSRGSLGRTSAAGSWFSQS